MMVERPVIFQNEGEQLFGVVHEPLGGGVKPGVIFYHGFTGNKLESHRIFVHAARKLAQAGFYVCRFDFRGSGDSGGEFHNMTISGEISDAIAALNWFKENTPVDKERMAILGFSLGGCVAAYTAAQCLVQALILWSAVAEPMQVFVKNTPYEVMKNQARKQGYLDFNGWPIGYDFLEELSSLNPLEVIQQYPGPALFIHGSKDQVVPVEQSRAYYQQLPSSTKELHIIEEADHTYNKIEWEHAVILKTVEWLQKKLK